MVMRRIDHGAAWAGCGRGRVVDMGVGMIVPMRMPVAMRWSDGRMVVVMGVGRGGNHARDVIL